MDLKPHSNFAWSIVWVSFTTLALTYAVWYSFSIFFVSLLKEFYWNRAIASGAFSIFVIFHGISGLLAGSMVNRHGPRIGLLLGSLFLGGGLILCSFTQTWWQFYIFFGVLAAAGVGATGWVPNTTIIQNVFKAKRGLAMGIISSGIGVGILVCVPLFQFLIIRLGWRKTYQIMAFFIPLIICAMATLFLKKPPRPSFLQDTEAPPPSREIKNSLPVAKSVEMSWTFRQAMTTKQFWLLGLSFFLGAFAVHSILTHHVAFLIDQGVEKLTASSIVGILGIVSVGGKIFWGVLSDRIGRENTYTAGIICLTLGISFLILYDISPRFFLPYSYAFFFGMGYAATATLSPLIAADFFSGHAYGSIFGTLFILNGIGGALGAWFAGFLYDRIGSYIPSFIIMIVFSLLGCLSIWWAAPRKIRI
jgi:MFS family permease